MSRYSRLWPFLLVVVDVLSTAMFVQPMRTLKSESVLSAMLKILDRLPHVTKRHLETDVGSEFLGKT